MQKRVVGNINELNEAARKTASEKSANTAGTNRDGCKANKTSFGRFKKFAAIVMLLIVSVFCAIGSADWIISQQKQLLGGSGSTFVYDKKTLQNYIALKGSDETEAAAKVAEAEEYASLQTETDSDDSAVADKFTVKKAAVSKKSAVSAYANGLESAIYGKSAIYNGKPIVAIKKTAGIDNAAAELPSNVLNGSLLTSYKPLTDGSVTEADLTEAYFAEGATSGLPQNAGTYAILVKIKELEAYGYAVKIFTILPCPVTVGWSGIDFANGFTYDGAAHPVTVAAKIASSDNGNIEGIEVNANLSVSITKDGASANEIKTAGNYVLTAASGNDNYVIYDTEATRTTSFTVKPAPLAVTVNNKTITYGDAVPGFTLSYEGFVGGETASVLGGTAIFTHGYEQFSDVGTYTVTASGLTSDNYEIKFVKGLLIVNQKTVGIDIIDKEIIYGDDAPSYSYEFGEGLTVEEAGQIDITFICAYKKGNNAGKYEIDANVNLSGNYSFNIKKGTLTVNPKELTLVAKDNAITYGDAPSANGYSFEGFVCGDTQATANIKAEVTFSYKYKQNGDIYDADGNKIAYYITPTINSFTSTNYTCTSTSPVKKGNLTVKKLAVSLNVIEENYNSGGLTFDKSLFDGAFTSANSHADLSKASDNIISDSENPITAKNFTGTADTSKAENGYFSYSFGMAIKVGSTYIIENIALADKCNYILTSSSTYLKYKTAKIGESSFFTIEDALAKSGDITIIGDSTDSASYVITAFSKLGLDSSKDSAFSDYKSNYAYTLNGKLIVSFDGQNSTEYSHNKSAYSKGFVNSAFIIPSGVTLTLAASSNLIIGAAVAFNQDVSTTVAMNRGVIMNNGQITAQNGSNISSYGYVKGTGNIIMQNGSKAVDALAIYDWPGGIAASSMYKNVFPSNAYTMHNISCKTVIYAGAIYSAKVYVYMSKFGIEKEVDVEQIIIGTQSDNEKGMFNLTNNSDKGKTDTYIIKSVTTYNGEINSSITSTNQRIKEGSDQYLNHRDKIEIYGNYSDDSLKITVEALGVKATLENNTSKPLPVGFMDVYVCRGTMNLTKSDYLILPGACIKVENGGTLNLGSNVDIVAMSYSSMPTGGRGYFNYYTSSTDGSGKQDGKLIVNGTLTGNDYNLGGKILTESANSTLTVVNASGSYVTMIATSDPYYQSGTLRATGNIMTDRSNYGEANFSTGTYYSKNVGTADSPVYAWFKNTATVTYVLNGGTLNGSQENHVETVTLTANGYTDMPVPSKPYYTFGGWFFDSDLSEPATSVYTYCTLYAKWNPIKYTVIYHIPDGFGSLTNGSFNGGETFNLPVLGNVTTEDGKTHYFNNWYLSADFSGASVTQISAQNATGTEVHVYANFIDEITYTVLFETGGNVDVEVPFQKGTDITKFEVPDLAGQYNNDISFAYEFIGWYTDSSFVNSFTSFEDMTIGSNNTFTLYAKWEAKGKLIIKNNSDLDIDQNITIDNVALALSAGKQTTLYFPIGKKISINHTLQNPVLTGGKGENTLTEHTPSLMLGGSDILSNEATTYTMSESSELTFSCTDVTYYKVTFYLKRGSNGTGAQATDSKNCSITLSLGDNTKYYEYSNEEHISNYSNKITTQTTQAEETKTNYYYLKEGSYQYKTTGDNDGSGTLIIPSDNQKIEVTTKNGECLVEGTLITLADGSQKKVEEITEKDTLLVFNHYTGKYDFAKVLFNDAERLTDYTVINLYFSNGKIVKVVSEHGFFDLNENKYVYIDESNYADYIGHRFYSATWDGTTYVDSIVTLDRVVITQEFVRVYSPVTAYHMNYFTENMLSMPGGVSGIFNIFEYGKDLKFDEDLMQKDIETYGEFTYEDFKDLVSEEIFNSFQTRYFTVAIGKGNLTMEMIKYYISRYGPLMS